MANSPKVNGKVVPINRDYFDNPTYFHPYTYEITSPEGERFDVIRMRDFCSDKGLKVNTFVSAFTSTYGGGFGVAKLKSGWSAIRHKNKVPKWTDYDHYKINTEYMLPKWHHTEKLHHVYQHCYVYRLVRGNEVYDVVDQHRFKVDFGIKPPMAHHFGNVAKWSHHKQRSPEVIEYLKGFMVFARSITRTEKSKFAVAVSNEKCRRWDDPEYAGRWKRKH